MKLVEKVVLFIVCLFAEFIAVYIFMKYARFSASDLWQLCALLVIASMTVQGILLKL